MKRLIFILAAAISFVALTGMTHTDREMNYELTLPESYILLTAENAGPQADKLEELGYYSDRVAAVLSSEQLSFGAFDTTSGDMHKSILMYISDLDSPDSQMADFKAEDLTKYLADYTALYTEKGYTAVSSETLDAKNNRHVKFIKLVLSKAGGEMPENMIIYKTVVNGISYELVYNDNAAVLSEQDAAVITGVFDSLRYLNVRRSSIFGLRPAAFFIILAAVAAALAVIIISVIFSRRRKKAAAPKPEPEPLVDLKTVSEILGAPAPPEDSPTESPEKNEPADVDAEKAETATVAFQDKDGTYKLRFEKVDIPKKAHGTGLNEEEEIDIEKLLNLPRPQDIIDGKHTDKKE